MADSRLRFALQSSCRVLRVSRASDTVAQPALCRLPAVAERMPFTVFQKHLWHCWQAMLQCQKSANCGSVIRACMCIGLVACSDASRLLGKPT